jgi:hypothetical protein
MDDNRMKRTRALLLPVLLSLALLSASCGGGGSAIVVGALVAIFLPDAATAAPRVSMEAGASSNDVFTVEIHADGITDVAGVAFTLLYDDAVVQYLGCQAQGSIFLSNPSLTNSCNNVVVGGARFNAKLQNNVPGILNVGAALEGLVAGVPAGTGLVLTLSFRALEEVPLPGTPLDFEAGPSRDVQVCTIASCTSATVNWDAGSMFANSI